MTIKFSSLCGLLVLGWSVFANPVFAQSPPPSTKKLVMKLWTPVPPYPYIQGESRVHGRGTVRISFDETGHPLDAEMEKSTGYGILDANTVHFVLRNWRTSGGRKITIHVPVAYGTSLNGRNG